MGGLSRGWCLVDVSSVLLKPCIVLGPQTAGYTICQTNPFDSCCLERLETYQKGGLDVLIRYHS